MSVVGQPLDRTDGPLKVEGQARYAAEFSPKGVAYAATGFTNQFLTAYGTANTGDIPAPADYNGTGKAQLALFRPTTDQFFIAGVGIVAGDEEQVADGAEQLAPG